MRLCDRQSDELLSICCDNELHSQSADEDGDNDDNSDDSVCPVCCDCPQSCDDTQVVDVDVQSEDWSLTDDDSEADDNAV